MAETTQTAQINSGTDGVEEFCSLNIPDTAANKVGLRSNHLYGIVRIVHIVLGKISCICDLFTLRKTDGLESRSYGKATGLYTWFSPVLA